MEIIKTKMKKLIRRIVLWAFRGMSVSKARELKKELDKVIAIDEAACSDANIKAVIRGSDLIASMKGYEDDRTNIRRNFVV